MFITVLLPDRKLRAWGEHDFTKLPAGKAGQRQALFWMFEDQLKARCVHSSCPSAVGPDSSSGCVCRDPERPNGPNVMHVLRNSSRIVVSSTRQPRKACVPAEGASVFCSSA